MSVEHTPGHQERVERLRATSPHPGALRSLPPLEGGLPCIEGRTEHCWHDGPFLSSGGTGWQGKQCCFCPAHQQQEFELRPPKGHGPNLPSPFYKWFAKEEARTHAEACAGRHETEPDGRPMQGGRCLDAEGRRL